MSIGICTIYVIRNLVNNKVYVGQTWGSLKERFRKHKLKNTCCIKLSNAFSKHGIENFYIEPIAYCDNQITADQSEKFLILAFDSIKNGYNIREGGSKGRQSEETKAKISAANKISQRGLKRPRSAEMIKKFQKTRRQNSRISEDIIREIRATYLLGNITHRQLADKYGIGKTTVTDILHFKIWKDIQ